MSNRILNLETEKLKLQQAIQFATEKLSKTPDGHVRICDYGKHPKFYLISDKDKSQKGTYLKKNQRELAENLIEKDFYLKVKETAEKQLSNLLRFEKSFDSGALTGFYDKLHPVRKAILQGNLLTDEGYLKYWRNQHPGGKNPFENRTDFYTELHEHVRSKSEVIIGDRLHAMGIPYVYEAELDVGEGYPIYPDFTLLDLKGRRTVYYEHLGKMDDEDYANKAVAKIHRYEKAGYRMGIELLITYETAKIPLNVKNLEKKLKDFIS